MAASINIVQTTAARGAVVAVIGAGYPPGRTEIIYLNGNYVDAKATSCTTSVTGGAFSSTVKVPSGTPTGAAKPVISKDGTDITITATDTLTVT